MMSILVIYIHAILHLFITMAFHHHGFLPPWLFTTMTFTTMTFTTIAWIQRRKPTRGGSVWTQVQQILFNTSSTTDVLTTCGFPVSGQFEAEKLTHFSTAPLRTPTIPRFKRSLLTCGDVQPNLGPTT